MNRKEKWEKRQEIKSECKLAKYAAEWEFEEQIEPITELYKKAMEPYEKIQEKAIEEADRIKERKLKELEAEPLDA